MPNTRSKTARASSLRRATFPFNAPRSPSKRFILHEDNVTDRMREAKGPQAKRPVMLGGVACIGSGLVPVPLSVPRRQGGNTRSQMKRRPSLRGANFPDNRQRSPSKQNCL